MSHDPPAPTCYRHPQRETYVRCVRCDRPICPDCMNQAPVGWQCPECVAAGRKATRTARTAFGGGPGGADGVVTKSLIGINIAVFLVGLVWGFASGAGNISDILLGGTNQLHIHGAAVAGPLIPLTNGQYALLGIANGEYYRLFTAMFLHYGIIHLAFNMYVLWVVGRFLERDLGRGRFLALYLVCGMGGNVATYLFAAPTTFSAGASSCIFGLFGALLLVNRKQGRDNSGMYALLALNLVITFLPGTNISITGHIGGLVTGLILGYALSHAPRQNRTIIQVGSFVVVLLLLAGLVVWRTGELMSSVPILT